MPHDVAIVGAGPVGATLALALADADLDLVVLDARAAGTIERGDRSLALSHGARLAFERIGVWRPLTAIPGAATPITAIDVSQAGGFGVARLEAADCGLPALGYVVRYRALQTTLDAALAARGVPVRWDTPIAGVAGSELHAVVKPARAGAEPVTARLAVIADGTGAAIEGADRFRHDYRQVAVVARIRSDPPPLGVAWERFTREGPVALLPEGGHYGLVLTATPARAAELLALDDATFLAELTRRFGATTPRFVGVEGRRSFPLVLEFVRDPVRDRCVALGNAAQTLHPVAGQGFNIGLRDGIDLAQVLIDTPRDAIGTPSMLARYKRTRRRDRQAGVMFTHGLLLAFGIDLAVARWSRGIALALFDAIPPAKRVFTRAVMFGVR